MKTIQVTDEMYSALMELSKEMNAQDNRSTAMPHMFQVRTREEVAAYPDCDSEVIWVNSDGDTLRGDDEIEDEILNIWANSEYPGFSDYTKLSEFQIESILEKNDFRKIEVTEKEVYQNTFFTAKACDEHIRLNKHHYRKPDCYLNHAGRNPEMDLVSKFLCELSGGEWRG